MSDHFLQRYKYLGANRCNLYLGNILTGGKIKEKKNEYQVVPVPIEGKYISLSSKDIKISYRYGTTSFDSFEASCPGNTKNTIGIGRGPDYKDMLWFGMPWSSDLSILNLQSEYPYLSEGYQYRDTFSPSFEWGCFSAGKINETTFKIVHLEIVSYSNMISDKWVEWKNKYVFNPLLSVSNAKGIRLINTYIDLNTGNVYSDPEPDINPVCLCAVYAHIWRYRFWYDVVISLNSISLFSNMPTDLHFTFFQHPPGNYDEYNIYYYNEREDEIFDVIGNDFIEELRDVVNAFKDSPNFGKKVILPDDIIEFYPFRSPGYSIEKIIGGG